MHKINCTRQFASKLALRSFALSLQNKHQNHRISMLGIKTRRAPIKGDIANEIRSAVVRVTTGQLNEREKESARRSKELLSRYKFKWVGLNG